MTDILTDRITEQKIDCIDVYEYMNNMVPVVTATGVADHFNVNHMTARKRLQELADAGRVVKLPLHETTTAWYLPECIERSDDEGE